MRRIILHFFFTVYWQSGRVDSPANKRSRNAFFLSFFLSASASATSPASVLRLDGDVIVSMSNSEEVFTVQTKLLVPEGGTVGARLVEVREQDRIFDSGSLDSEKLGTWSLPAPMMPDTFTSNYFCESVEILDSTTGEEYTREYRYYEVGKEGALVSISAESWSEMAEGEVIERGNRFGVLEEERVAGPQRRGLPDRTEAELQAMLLRQMVLIEAGETKTEGVVVQGGVK